MLDGVVICIPFDPKLAHTRRDHVFYPRPELNSTDRKKVGAVLKALSGTAVKALETHGTFKLPQFFKLSRNLKPERASTTKNICGRAVLLPHLPPRFEVRCIASKPFVRELEETCGSMAAEGDRTP